MRFLFLIITFTLFFSCSHKEKDSVKNIVLQDLKEKPFNTDSLWNEIIALNGCLAGGQYAKNERFGNEGCIIDRSDSWKSFLSQNKDSLTFFLLEKLPKTDSTYTHTCPFFTATEGELAVYALQRIHQKNWFDFDVFSEYQSKEITSAIDNHQAWLQAILKDEKQRNLMKSLWLNELNTVTSHHR